MNSFANGLEGLNLYFALIFCGFLLLQIILIFVGLKFKSRGYRIFLGTISVLMLILAFFCFQHELQFYLIGTAIMVSAFAGLFISFIRNKPGKSRENPS